MKSEKYHINPESFENALKFTEGKTGFTARLIEKDYYCSMILKELYSGDDHPLIFKGGTLLNKVHAPFYRLSEDLDFSINVDEKTTRQGRSKLVAPIKILFKHICSMLEYTIEKELMGSNESFQYNGWVGYQSVITKNKENISFEVGIREKIFEPVFKGMANTLLMDPFTAKPIISPFMVIGLSVLESYAEKIRAVFERLTPAIRDIYDIFYAHENKIIDFTNKNLLTLIKLKLKVKNVAKFNIAPHRKEEFQAQLENNLKPVLREKDYLSFDFERAWKIVLKVAKRLS